jgi:hypothetical protein
MVKAEDLQKEAEEDSPLSLSCSFFMDPIAFVTNNLTQVFRVICVLEGSEHANP